MAHELTKASLAAIAAALSAQPAVAQEIDPNIIIVEAQRENQTEVRGGGNLGVLGNKAAEDVPFSVRTFDESLILNQQPQTIGDVLQNDPTVRTTYGFGNAAEQFVIRGFTLFGDDVGMNGLYGVTPRQLVTPELYEGVQVLNGSSAFLNGAAPGGTGIGGGVNLQLKRARSQPLNRATLNYTSDAHFGGSFDVSRRFGGSDQFGGRLNGVFRSGDVSIDDEFRETLAIGGGFDFTTDNVRLSLNVGYQDVRVERLRPKVLTDIGIPRVPDSDQNYGQPFSFTDLESLFGVASFEYDFDDNATVYFKAGALDSNEEGVYSDFTLTNLANGDGTAGALVAPARQNNEAIEGGVRVKLGSDITQEFNFGGNISWQEFRTGFNFAVLPSNLTNLYDTPKLNYQGPNGFPFGSLTDPSVTADSRLWSVFASDTIGLWDERILLTAGLRLQHVKTKSFLANGAFLGSTNDNEVTPVVGLVVKPVEGLSLFANRIEGFQIGRTAPGTGPNNETVTNANGFLPPFTSVQYEVGGKFTTDRFSGSLALFQIEQPTVGLDNDPNIPGNLIGGDFGEQRNRGVELFLSGEPADGLRLIAGGTYVDAELRETIGGQYDGNDAVGIPEYTANANVEWDTAFVPGLTLTGRVVHTGRQAANLSNSQRLDDWTTLDLGARFVLAAGNAPITLRFGVDNVTDEKYWASAYTFFTDAASPNRARLLQGKPRTFKASISADF